MTLEVAIKDQLWNDINLPIKISWRDASNQQTYVFRDFWDNNLITLSHRVPRSEEEGLIIFWESNSQIRLWRRILDDNYTFRINYNFEGGASKSELYYLIVERNENIYSIVDFYSQTEREVREEVIVQETDVFMKGVISSPELFFAMRGIEVSLVNDEGDTLYRGFTDREGNFSIRLDNFQDKISLGRNYYLIYGKEGDPETNEIGFLYQSRVFRFPSYIDFVNFFATDLQLSATVNAKDRKLVENFPYFQLIFQILALWVFTYFFIIKKGIEKIFFHPYKKRNRVVYLKRKDMIEKLRNNGLWKNY